MVTQTYSSSIRISIHICIFFVFHRSCVVSDSDNDIDSKDNNDHDRKVCQLLYQRRGKLKNTDEYHDDDDEDEDEGGEDRQIPALPTSKS